MNSSGIAIGGNIGAQASKPADPETISGQISHLDGLIRQLTNMLDGSIAIADRLAGSQPTPPGANILNQIEGDAGSLVERLQRRTSKLGYLIQGLEEAQGRANRAL